MRVEAGEGGDQGGGLRAVLAQRGHEEGVLGVWKGGPRHRGEHGVRAQLHVTAHTPPVQGPHPVGEPDGLTHVPHP
ncbi:hypothetical protein G6539_32085, partial [Streptomyces albidoflavus]|nr:hypothetical protein [Streptomyces albidoflavus]